MISRDQAVVIAEAQLGRMESELPLVIASVVEKPFGWVFFYQSRAYVETGVIYYKLAGNVPFVVRADTGAVDYLEPTGDLNERLARYEAALLAEREGA